MTQPFAGTAETLLAANAAADIPAATVQTVSTNAASTIALITTRTKNILQGLWSNTNPYNDKQVMEFVNSAKPVLVAAQKATAQTAAAAQTAMLRSMGIDAVVVPKLPDDIRVPHTKAATLTYDQGTVQVTPQDSANDQLLQRPAKGFRWRESTGADDAQQFSITRLDDIVDGNIVIAQRDAEHQVLNFKGEAVTSSRTRNRLGVLIIGFRRIIHPEFSTGGVCGLCVAASDRVYHRETLRPIHLRCKCTSAPVTKTYDPGQALNADDLRRLYNDAGTTSAADLKKTRYTVTYSELGPTLVPVAGETVPYFTPLAA